MDKILLAVPQPAGSNGYRDVGEKLGKSNDACKHRAKLLGVHRARPKVVWTEPMIARLKSDYRIYRMVEIATRLGVSYTAVRHAVSRYITEYETAPMSALTEPAIKRGMNEKHIAEMYAGRRYDDHGMDLTDQLQ